MRGHLHQGLFVTGIGTDVGKTVVSAILVTALGYDYWKPLQSGSLGATDSDRVRALVPKARVWPEAYRFAEPLSPDAAAAASGVAVQWSRLARPEMERPVVVEGAGGALVPITGDRLMIDLMVELALPVVVVARSYLGMINHTLLTIEALRARELTVAGVVFVGDTPPASEQAILAFARVRRLGAVPWAGDVVGGGTGVDEAFVATQARQFRRLRDELG